MSRSPRSRVHSPSAASVSPGKCSPISSRKVAPRRTRAKDAGARTSTPSHRLPKCDPRTEDPAPISPIRSRRRARRARCDRKEPSLEPRSATFPSIELVRGSRCGDHPEKGPVRARCGRRRCAPSSPKRQIEWSLRIEAARAPPGRTMRILAMGTIGMKVPECRLRRGIAAWASGLLSFTPSGDVASPSPVSHAESVTRRVP